MGWLAFGFQEVMALSGPRVDRMKNVSFNISGRRFILPIPRDGFSRDVSRAKIFSDVDLDNFRSPSVLLDELWDWRGPFWQGVHGSLAIKVRIVAAPPDIRLECVDELRHMVQAQFEKDRQEFVAAGGQERFRTDYVLDPDLLLMNGVAALIYRESGFGDGLHVVVPIASRSFLNVHFNYLRGNPSGISSSWRVDAENVTNSIIGGMEFAGSWLPIVSCSGSGL